MTSQLFALDATKLPWEERYSEAIGKAIYRKELFSDPDTGMLVRLVRYEETPLGRNPTQIDYADYRDSGGVKVPFRWTIARPGGRFTIQVDQTEQNVAIDDAKFAKRASSAATGQNPPPSP